MCNSIIGVLWAIMHTDKDLPCCLITWGLKVIYIDIKENGFAARERRSICRYRFRTTKTYVLDSSHCFSIFLTRKPSINLYGRGWLFINLVFNLCPTCAAFGTSDTHASYIIFTPFSSLGGCNELTWLIWEGPTDEVSRKKIQCRAAAARL